MSQDEFEKLIKSLCDLSTENEFVEFKTNFINSEEIGKRISALSNTACLYGSKNAYLVFGVEDKTHNIIGTDFLPSLKKKGNEELEFWLSKYLDPRIVFEILEKKINGKQVVLFIISPAIDQPVKFRGLAYIRIHSSTPLLSKYPEKERKIWNNLKNKNFEKCIAKENISVSKVLKLLDYSVFFSRINKEISLNLELVVDTMVQYGLVKKNFNNNYDITNLGAILFAKDFKDFPTIKRKTVRVVLYKGNSKNEKIREKEFFSGYAIIFENLIEYINDMLPQNEKINEALREQVRMYPEIAIREFVANALIHQDLTVSGAGTTVEVFDNCVEIINTGKPLIALDRFIDYPPVSRNEDLAAFMRQIGFCEERGTGIDRALVEIALYQLPAPKFEKFDYFTKVILYSYKKLREMTMDDKVRACFYHCVLRYVNKLKMTNASLRQRFGIKESNYPIASNIIKETINRGFIKESEKSKEYIPYWG